MDILKQLDKQVPSDGKVDILPDINSEEFLKVVESRRSVRRYLPDPVSESVMNKIIDCGLKAPNSSNLQPWEFYWVKSKDKKDLLVKACLSQPAAKTAPELVVCVARTNTWNAASQWNLDVLTKNNAPSAALTYYKRLVPLAYGQGFLGLKGLAKKVAVFFMRLKAPTPSGPVSEHDMEVWATKSTALACENMMLAARALGYDSCPMEGFDESKVLSLLNLSQGARVCMVISFGKRGPGGVYGPQLRRPKSEVVFEV